MQKTLVIGGICLLLVIIALVGYCKSERRKARVAFELLSSEAERADLDVAADKAEIACQDAWLEYRKEESEADLIRLKSGELAYDKYEAKIFKDKPICPDRGTGLSNILNGPDMRLLDDSTRAQELRSEANAALEYSKDWEKQVRRLFH